MANLREIAHRMQSVRSTMQITRTMEMVSTAKIRGALERAEQAGPYKDAITRMLANVAGSAGSGVNEPLLQPHGHERCILYVVIASDRGLAGGFNINPQREVLSAIQNIQGMGREARVITCGRKPTEFFRTRGIEPVLAFEGISGEPTMDEADRIASYAMEGYASGAIDRVIIYYHHAKSRVDQVEVVEQLLPISTEDLFMPNDPREGEEGTFRVQHVRDTQFRFEPNAREVLGHLIPAYVRTVVFHALLDSAAAEHGARRVAMQNATENAEEVITNLSRTYNRTRQGSITTELNEIIGGASALEEDQ